MRVGGGGGRGCFRGQSSTVFRDWRWFSCLHCGEVSVFQEFYANIDKIFILAGRLGARL